MDEPEAPHRESPASWPLLIVDDRQKVVAGFCLRDAAATAGANGPRDLADALSAEGLDLGAIGELLSWIEEGVDAVLDLPAGPYRNVALGRLKGAAGGAYVALVARRPEATASLRAKVKAFAQAVWLDHADARLGACAVLAVDDSAVSGAVLSRALRALGCKADLARSAGEAFGMCSKRDYDLVFADVSMPGIDGRDLARILRRWPKLAARRLLIVGLGSEGGEFEREACRQAGMDGYIVKPPSRADLKPFLRAALEKDPSSVPGLDRLSEPERERDWREAEVLDARAWEEESALHRRLVKRFLADGAGALAKLASGTVEERSFELTLHAFKGSADAVRAIRLAGVCGEILARLREGRAVAARALVDELAAEFESLESAARSLGMLDSPECG